MVEPMLFCLSSFKANQQLPALEISSYGADWTVQHGRQVESLMKNESEAEMLASSWPFGIEIKYLHLYILSLL